MRRLETDKTEKAPTKTHTTISLFSGCASGRRHTIVASAGCGCAVGAARDSTKRWLPTECHQPDCEGIGCGGGKGMEEEMAEAETVEVEVQMISRSSWTLNGIFMGPKLGRG